MDPPSGSPPRRRNGFTLVELLVVVAILAILAAIALPRFSSVRVRSHDATVKSDLRNAMNMEEQYFADHGTYLPFSIVDGGREDELGFRASPRVSVEATLEEDGTLMIVGSHAAGSSAWCLSNATGQLVQGDAC